MYFEYGGGLGDVLMRCYRGQSYRKLAALKERARVVLVCHNPHARELFDNHPKRELMDLEVLPYWLPDRDGEMRAAYNLPGPTAVPGYDRDTEGMDYYPTASDLELLAARPARYVAVAPGAGLPGRNLPPHLVSEWCKRAAGSGFGVVLVGKSFDRHGRSEPMAGYQGDGVLNLTDRLSVAGSMLAVRGAEAVVCCHSAAVVVAWEERKPVLVAYPEECRVRHFQLEDQWSFGMGRDDTFQACLGDEWGLQYAADNFFAFLRQRARDPRLGFPCDPYPLAAHNLSLVYRGVRWTPEQDARLLLHEVGKVPGNILEVGCSVGSTTLELATAFPDKTVYAVDCGEIRTGLQQQSNRVNRDNFCVHARHLPNVVPLYANAQNLQPSMLPGVGSVFIDGDHTYYGVKRDAGLADALKPSLIAYHDVSATPRDWVGVNQVLRERAAAGRPVRMTLGSGLAFERYQ